MDDIDVEEEYGSPLIENFDIGNWNVDDDTDDEIDIV